MDKEKLLNYAGISTDTEYMKSIDELALLEKMFQGKYNLDIDTDVVPVEELQDRLEAASRALSIANRLRNSDDKRRHLSRVMSNLNTIRSALNHAMKQLGR